MNEEAIKILKKSFKEDFDYAWTWHCNIAVCAMDEGLNHAASNRAAARFMKLAFDIDTTNSFRFKSTQISK